MVCFLLLAGGLRIFILFSLGLSINYLFPIKCFFGISNFLYTTATKNYLKTDKKIMLRNIRTFSILFFSFHSRLLIF